MKALLLVLALVSSAAFGSGTVMVEPRYSNTTGKTYLIGGLGVYEKLFDNVAYNSWTGTGQGMSEDGLTDTYSPWYVTKHQIDMKVLFLTVSPGLRFAYSEKSGDMTLKTIETEGFVKVSFRVW